MSSKRDDLISLTEASRILELSTVQTRRLADSGDLRMVPSPYGRLIGRRSAERLAAKRSKQGKRSNKRVVR